MYTAYYNLREKPFKEAIDPKFTWLSNKHLEALSAFKYAALEKKGFILLTGEVGTGKTTIIKRFLNEIEPNAIVANVVDPDLDKIDFFKYLSDEFKMNMMSKSKADFLITFKKFLFDAYQKNISVLLIIDEAHKINQELLEEIRVLSNIETYESKLINIFFVGQTEFNNILLHKRNRGLKTRISVNCHLEPLSEDETEQLILYRLKVAGTESKIFSSNAFHEIHLFSAGVPRLVITICDRAMLTGYIKGTNIIDKDIILQCAEELRFLVVEERRANREKFKRIARSRILAAKAHDENDKKRKKFSISELVIKIIPITKRALLPALPAIIAVVVVYLIYEFISILLPWTSIIPSQKKPAVLQSEHSDPSAVKKNVNEYEETIIKSIISEEKQEKLPNASYSTDNIRSETKRVSSLMDRSPSKLSEIDKNIDSDKKELKGLLDDTGSNLEFKTENRQEKEKRVARIEPKIVSVTGKQPKRVSKSIEDSQSRQAPSNVKVRGKKIEEDLKPTKDTQSQQPLTKKLESQVHTLESDLELKTKAQRKPDNEIAHMEQASVESNRRSRYSLEEQLQAFLQNYCHTYEAKDLDEFAAFFTMDAKENDKPFYRLLPQYRRNFNSIDLINYRIELQEYKYNEADGIVSIEGRFFLKWLPHGSNWRQNSGKIFMELQEHGTSYRVNRLDYYGEGRKKTE